MCNPRQRALEGGGRREKVRHQNDTQNEAGSAGVRRGNALVVDRKTHDGEDRRNRGEVELETSEGEG